MTNDNNAKDDWVKRVLGVEMARPLDESSVRGRLNEVGIALRNSRGVPDFHALTKQMSKAVALLRNGDLAGAMEQVTEIATALSRQQSLVRGQELSGDGLSLRAVAAASLEWRRLYADTARRIEDLKTFILEAMLEDDDFDPDDIEAVRGNLDRLDEVTLGMHDAIADMLDDLINAQPQERTKHVEAIRKALDEQEKFVASNEVVAAIDANGAVPTNIASQVGAVINAMRSALP